MYYMQRITCKCTFNTSVTNKSFTSGYNNNKMDTSKQTGDNSISTQ